MLCRDPEKVQTVQTVIQDLDNLINKYNERIKQSQSGKKPIEIDIEEM